MVVRKPTPAGVFTPMSSTPPVPSDQTQTRATNGFQIPSQYGHHHSRPNTDIQDDVQQSYPIEPGNANLDGRSEEKPLPVLLRPGVANPTQEELLNELPRALRSGLSASARVTPRSSLDSGRSGEFWDEKSQGNGHAGAGINQSQQSPPLQDRSAWTREPPIASLSPNCPGSSLLDLRNQPQPIRPNNPFRRFHSENDSTPHQGHSSDGLLSKQEFAGKGRDVGSPPETPIEMTANLSLADRPFSEYSSSYRPSHINLNSVYQKQGPEQKDQTPDFTKPPIPSTLPPPISLCRTPDESHQSPLIPVSTEIAAATDTRSWRSGIANNADGSTHDRATAQVEDISAPGADLGKELPVPPQADAASTGDIGSSVARPSTILSQAATSSRVTTSQETPSLEHPPPKPPRPQLPLSTAVEADTTRLKEQRNETYQIKHFNWFDHTNRTLRRSSMLTQNKNGPCPLLALVNALILGAENDSRSALAAALRPREQVSLGLIIESLMDELTSERRRGPSTELPDVDELNRFLLMLHTGMTANPRLAAASTPSPNLMDARNSSLHLPQLLNSDRQPGTFEATQDMRLYGAFGIPLVHGWLPSRSDPARAAFTRSAQTYEDAQTIQFGEEELEDKLSRVGLTSEEQQLLQDISSIKSFWQTHPTQITPYGLEIINESLFPGSVAILFRNDHFCTLYKHPDSGQLFTLVTDAGYSDKAEVVWESLVDVSGQNSEFFSGDFRPVGNVEAQNQGQGHRSQGNDSSTPGAHRPSSQAQGPRSPSSFEDQQQQADADFAMALQLQEEEEARLDDNCQSFGVTGATTNHSSDPINPRRQRDQDSNRPAIPPRNARNQGVNRPSDPTSDEPPPPAYEEAAKGKPYLPPIGHPHHSPYHGRSPTSGPPTPMYPTGPRPGQPHPRRMSAFQETSQFQSSPPLTRPHSNNHIGIAQSSTRPRDRDKDCIVM